MNIQVRFGVTLFGTLLLTLPLYRLGVIHDTADAQTSALPFQEQSGQVVMEAENFHTTISRSGKSWIAQTTPTGFAGAGAMKALPDSNTSINSGYATTSPELQFQVQFATAGTYHVWIRGLAVSGGNTAHVGLNGQPVATADRVELKPPNTWVWTKSTMDGPVATLSIPAAGLHTINIWMREDGFSVDRLLLTTSSTFTPSGTGPAESPRSGGGGTTNQPPVVNAGADQTITLPNSATLTGSAKDDGLPNPPGTLTYTWSKVGGPGTVTFGSASSPGTTASFSAAGTYTLRLTVSDSAATASDDVVVTVTQTQTSPPPGSPFQEQSGQVVMEAENFHTNINRSGKSWSAQTTPAGFVGVSAMQSLPNSGTILDSGFATTSPEMQFQVQFATAGTYHVWIRGFATTTNDNSVHFGVNGQPLTSADRVELLSPLNTWAWSKATMDGPVATLSIPSAGLHTINLWMREDGFYVDRLLLTTNSTFTPSGNGPAESPRSTGGTTNQPPVVNAGADQTITLPSSATLTGSANDDGLPNPPGTLTYTWSKVTGPGTVTFASVSSPSTTASFSAAGSYTLRLTVSDSAATASDDVAVTVQSSTSTASPFQEQSGQVVMEAENFHTSVSRGGKSWSAQTTPAGFVGVSAMQSLPNSGTILDSGFATTSPEMQFQVQFATAGTYHVWIRGFATTTNDNSVHFGVNGQPLTSADRVELLSPLNTWAWSKATMDGPVATLSIPSAGLHTINLWMREDGFYVDRLLLTTNSTFTPSGNGPAESPRSGTTGPTPPPAPTGLTATGGTTSIALTWNASTGATGYNVYRSTTTPVSTTGTPLNGSTPLTTTSYSDTAVSAGITYHYVVTALNAAGSSPPSATVSAQLGSSSTITCATSSNPTLLNFSASVAGTYGSSGFNCFMPGTDQPTGAGLVLNAANSHLAVTSTEGDLFQFTNTQDNAVALKLTNSGSYAVRARIKGPFTTTTAFQSAGVFLALNADNYAKLTVGHGSGGPRLEFAVETAAAFAQGAADVTFSPASLDQSSEALDLWLVRNSNGTLQALYRQVTNLTSTPVLGPIVSVGVTSSAPAWATSNAELYGGVVTTDFGSGGAFDTFFDEFQLSGPPSTSPPPSTGWASETSLPIAVQEVSVAALSNKVYVAGGDTANGRVQTLYVFDPASPSWLSLAPYPGAGRDHIGIAATGGFIYLIGGITAWPQPSVATVQRYDPAANAWATMASLPSPRGAMGVAVLNGKIYAAGGLREGLAVTDFTVYDPATNTWQTLPSMPTARDHLVGVALDGKFYALGGRPGGNSICSPVTTVEVYDPVTNSWSTKAPMAVPRGGHAAGTLNGKIQVFGGEGGPTCGIIASSEEYDPATNSWTSLPAMPIPRHGTGGATIGGKIYLPGGATATGHQPTAAHQSFSQATTQPPPGSPPAAPTGVTATGGTSAITLAWNASTGATGYNVYRSTTSTVSTSGAPLNGSTPLTTTSYSDTAVSAGVTYHYVVTALNAAGSSPPSATVSAQLGSSSTITCATSSNPTLLNFSASVAGTYGSSGFNCFMPGTVQPTGPGVSLNAASSHLTITSTEGDLFQSTNTQNNALALKLSNSGTYAVRARVKGPFSTTTAFQGAGVFLALNADNYAKFTIGHGNAGPRFEFAVETAGAFASAAPDSTFNPANVDQASEALDLWLVRNSNGTLQALYRQVTNLTSTPVLGAIVSVGVTSTAPSWAASNAELYGGVLTTDFGSGGAFDTFFDEFQLSGAPTEPPTNSPPTAPTGVTATGGTTAITLTWNASTGATGYNVYRSTTTPVSTTGTPLNGSTPLTTTSYSDTAVSSGVTYHYVVTALNAVGSSPPSATVSAQLGSSSTVTCTTSSNPSLLNFSGSVAGTYGSTGFNCFMPGTVQPTGAGLVLSGFNSHLVVTSTDGDIFQTTNTQNNALALKLANSASYSVRVRIKGPFSATTAFQSSGVFLALNADNYAKLAVGQGSGGLRLEFAVETGATFAPAAADVAFGSTSLDQASEALDLWLVRKSDGTIEALYRQVTNLTSSPVLGPIVSVGTTASAPSWSASSAELHGGLLTTDTGSGGSIDTFFDEFQLGGPVSQSSTPTPTSFTKKVIAKTGSTSGTAFGVSGFDNPTSLELGPDGKLFVATQSGKIYIMTIDHQQLPTASGMAVTHVQTLNDIFNRTTLTCNIGGVPSNCQFVSGTPTGRLAAGLAIGPESTSQQVVLYVTHSDPRIGENNSSTALSIDTWSGTITRLFLQPGTGGNYVVSSQQDLVVGLPRSRENHGPNGIAFGPDGWMYFTVGGNTNYGKPSTFFSMLPEYYLAAAALRLNVTGLGTALPLNVKGVSSASGMTQFAGKLELFATGFRNAYDLVWHSNGNLYLNDNAGNAGLGNTPDSADGCSTPSINPGTLPDTLQKITSGTYGGHPNPSRGECVLNSGSLYSPPLPADPQYAPPLLAYNQGASTNGIVEYTSNAFNGALTGNLISATYAGNQNVRRVVLNSSGTGVLQEVNLGTFSQPLDVTSDAAGIIFVAEHGADQITVLIPEQTASTCPSSASSDDDGDGFTDSDEATHGTDPCSSASFPPDLDGDHVGNLTDTDLDGDGIANTTDQLHYDPQNGAATSLPVNFEWNPGNTPLGGIANTGFTGAQISSSGPRLGTSAIHVGAAGGFMSLDTFAGTADGPLNNQVNALQVGFNSTAPFTISSRIVEPFNSVTAAPGHLAGIFFGPNQNNFLRLGIVGDTNGQKAVQLAFEQAGAFSEAARVSLPTGAVLMLDLYLVANPNTQIISAYYELNQSGSLVLVEELAVPAAWFNNNQGAAAGTSLAGVITSHGSAAPMTFVYDFFRIQATAPQAAAADLLVESEQVRAGAVDIWMREESHRIEMQR